MPNYRDLMRRFFGVRQKPTPTSTPAPAHKGPQDYVTDLDNILKNAQLKLTNLLQSPDLRPLRRYLGDVDFTHETERFKKFKKLPPIPAPKDPNLDLSKNPPVPNSRKGLPINSVIEGAHINFKKRADGLRELLNETAVEIQKYLLDMAQSVNYNPPKKDIRSLTTDLSKNMFTGIDRKTILQVLKKIKVFRGAYDYLMTWIIFFERTEKNQAKAARKKI